ncbi:MAG: hypothetical protein JWM22_1937 [Frankiales bacterium]|nr:hypothetical protein [Frankiales bacterium]
MASDDQAAPPAGRTVSICLGIASISILTAIRGLVAPTSWFGLQFRDGRSPRVGAINRVQMDIAWCSTLSVVCLPPGHHETTRSGHLLPLDTALSGATEPTVDGGPPVLERVVAHPVIAGCRIASDGDRQGAARMITRLTQEELASLGAMALNGDEAKPLGEWKIRSGRTRGIADSEQQPEQDRGHARPDDAPRAPRSRGRNSGHSSVTVP